MTAADDWSTQEVVRAVNRLSTALERFEQGVEATFSGLDSKYVPREVYLAENRRSEEAIQAIRLEMVSRAVYAAEKQRQEEAITALRTDRETARSWVRELVAPTVSALLVGVVLLAVGLLTR